MSANTVAPMKIELYHDKFSDREVKTCNDWSQVVADKFESQEKEIDYLKKNALAQEIKINELIKLVDQLIVARDDVPKDNFLKRVWEEITIEGNRYTEEENKSMSERCRNSDLPKNYYGLSVAHNNIMNAKSNEIKEREEKAKRESAQILVEAQEKLKAKEIAEKKEKAMKDMMARVALLEETAKKEEDELENLKLINEPTTDEEIEDPVIVEMRIREANVLARVAEMRAEKATLRGTQKNSTPDSGNPSTWSKEKAEKISKMWCE